jgi:hypothetical protein
MCDFAVILNDDSLLRAWREDAGRSKMTIAITHH